MLFGLPCCHFALAEMTRAQGLRVQYLFGVPRRTQVIAGLRGLLAVLTMVLDLFSQVATLKATLESDSAMLKSASMLSKVRLYCWDVLQDV